MAVKIRLQRHGKKGQPFYHIVIADARAARDGKFIEKLGTYNPLTQPATIVVDADRVCKWLRDGAQPTDTVRSLLRYKGVLYKYHLQRGVEKGAFTQEVADKRYIDFVEQKEKQIAEAIVKIKNDKNVKRKEALKHEEEVNAKKAQELADKRAAAVAKQAEEAQKPEENTEAAPEEAPQAE
ncbi:MAG: 30S ribosomal protein S16 [Bacteroidales bacterium]|nr:30S ribosomal protein S16 [Bacteroidales bacterium]MDY6424618.1 30S ribosomal protein S16 [Bacteroidales bacterium]